MANLRRIKAVADILAAAGVDPDKGYFDMQHDILYIPWEQETGAVAQQLKVAGCHWDEDGDCWASF